MVLNLPGIGIGFLAAIIIAALAYKAHSLNSGGAMAAVLLGTVIFGLGGFAWAVLLIGFFVSSSLLSRLFRQQKAALSEKFSKGSQRDAGQVLANGGVAGLIVLIHFFFPQADFLWAAFAASLAAVNADTWATEIGVLSRKAPRLVTSFKPVERGTSGGITSLGTLASLGGSLLIALLAVVLWRGEPMFEGPLQVIGSLVFVTLGGALGSLVDSVLGATIQSIYRCPVCEKETERHPLHACGSETIPLRGWRWLENDWVNAISSLTAVLFVVLVGMVV